MKGTAVKKLASKFVMVIEKWQNNEGVNYFWTPRIWYPGKPIVCTLQCTIAHTEIKLLNLTQIL